MKRIGVRRLGLAALLAGGVALPAHAIIITPTNDAFGLANTLFLNVGGLTVNSAAFSSGAQAAGSSEFQAGTFINPQGTFGLPSPGIVLSTGNVNDTATGASCCSNGSFEVQATDEQQALLEPITGESRHFDVAQLDIGFFSPVATTATFFATFGSQEFPNYVGGFVDGFGLYVNGQNVAGVLPTGGLPGDELLPVNIDHPDMTAGIPGTIFEGGIEFPDVDEGGEFVDFTEFDDEPDFEEPEPIILDGGVLAPNGNPVLRFDVPIVAGDNNFTIIIADANDSAVDTAIYLSSFFGNIELPGTGTTEFNPVLPSNPPDPETGTFVIEIPEVDAGTIVWIDPPVSVGFEYVVQGGPAFASIQAPSLATVPDLDGYFITVGLDTAMLLPGASLDFLSVFGVQPTAFTLTGINPALMLDPTDPLAFPLGVAFNQTAFQTTVLMTPIIEEFGDPGVIPLPATAVLYLGGIAVAGLMMRRRKAA